MWITRLIAASFFIAAGCSAHAETLRIGGTGVSLGGMRIMGEAFEKQNPGVTVEVLPSLGSTGGARALAAGALDLSMTSRPLKDEEAAKGLSATPYATTQLAIATSADTRTDGITTQQLADMYAGRVQNWPTGERVRLVLRPQSESDVAILRGLSDEMAAAVDAAFERPGLVLATNDQDNADTLERLPGSLGAIAVGQIATEGRRLKVLKLDGVLPTSATDDPAAADREAERRSKAFAKTLYLIQPAEMSATAEAFLTFVYSPAGQSILAAHDHTPVR